MSSQPFLLLGNIMKVGLDSGVETSFEEGRLGIKVSGSPQLLYSSQMSELYEVIGSPYRWRDAINRACSSKLEPSPLWAPESRT